MNMLLNPTFIYLKSNYTDFIHHLTYETPENSENSHHSIQRTQDDDVYRRLVLSDTKSRAPKY